MALVRLTDGLWVGTAPVKILGMPFEATMTVLGLADGSLLVHSPAPLTPQRRKAVETLGPVAHLYAPSLFHHRWVGDWAAAFPTARLHAPSGLAKKRPDLRIDRAHGVDPEPAFADVIDEIPISGCRLGETAVFHKPTGTLVVADLVHNVGRPEHPWSRRYAKVMGFCDRVALSRALRWSVFSDRAAARRSLDALLALPFDRLVVGHGAPLESGGKEALEAAYAWLPSTVT